MTQENKYTEKMTLSWMFYYEFWRIFPKTIFLEYLWEIGSVYIY